jgi:hypothetical protein
MHIKKIISVLLLVVFIQQANAQCVAGDCQNGNGTYKLPNGDMYTGNWVNGVREGYGRYDWSNGSYYVGDFKNNMLNGKGAFYGADGKQMIGMFIENNYAGENPDSTAVAGYDPNAVTTTLWNDMKRRDSVARAETLKKAKRVEFCQMVQMLVQDYGNQFVSYLGERQEIVLDRNMNWYATLMATGSIEAGVNGEKGKSDRTYYNILFESADSAAAMQTYKNYVEQLKTCDNGCCTMVFDTYDYASGAYRSYTTTWATLVVSEKYEPLVFNNMIMELECLTHVGRPGWMVLFRMYDAQALKEDK